MVGESSVSSLPGRALAESAAVPSAGKVSLCWHHCRQEPAKTALAPKNHKPTEAVESMGRIF